MKHTSVAVIILISIISITISAKCDELYQITLDSLLETQINSASKYAQTMSEAPSSVSIVTSQDIENYGYETLADVFASLKGFYTSYDRNYSYLGVRGFSRPTDYNNRILLQINGITVNEGVFGSAQIDTSLLLNPESIDRIEIIRGPGSALYGANAMFAIVNVVTKTGYMMNGIGLTSEIGSYGRKKVSGIYGAEMDSGIDFMVSGIVGEIEGDDQYYKEFDHTETNNGIAEGIDGDRHHSVFTSVKSNNMALYGMLTDRIKETPTGAWGTIFNSDQNDIRDKNMLLGITYQKRISERQKLDFKGFYNRYEFNADYEYNNPDETDSIYSDSALGTKYGSEVQYTLDTGPANRLIAGIEYQNNNKVEYIYWNSEEVLFNDDSPYTIWSGYMQDTYQFGKSVSATIGLRADEYSLYGTKVTPRIALIYNPYYTTTVKMIHGRAFRTPNEYEANYEEDEYWKRNNDLENEKISTTELVWEQRISKFIMGSTTVYTYKIENMIDTLYDDAEELFYYDNIDKVIARGVEVGIDARFDFNRNFYANYTFQDTHVGMNHTTQSNSPSHIMKIGLTGPLLKNIFAATEMRYESERLTVYGTRTDDFILTNVKLSTNTILNHMKITFSVRNIFDVAYFNPGGFEHTQDSIRQDGRNYNLKVQILY